jgi:hypothetical protein
MICHFIVFIHILPVSPFCYFLNHRIASISVSPYRCFIGCTLSKKAPVAFLYVWNMTRSWFVGLFRQLSWDFFSIQYCWGPHTRRLCPLPDRLPLERRWTNLPPPIAPRPAVAPCSDAEQDTPPLPVPKSTVTPCTNRSCRSTLGGVPHSVHGGFIPYSSPLGCTGTDWRSIRSWTDLFCWWRTLTCLDLFWDFYFFVFYTTKDRTRIFLCESCLPEFAC